MAIDAIAQFFGSLYGQYRVERLFRTIGIEDLPTGSKGEIISKVLKRYYGNDNDVFVACMNALIRHHSLGLQDIQTLRKETLRLGFDIKDNCLEPSIGRESVIEENKPYDAFKIIEKIILSAKKRIFLIDPYVDHTLFPLYLDEVPESVEIKIITTKMQGKFEEVARIFKSQKKNLEVRLSRDIHDRNILIDNRAWIFGQSIKDAGSKLLNIVELEDSSQVEQNFLRLWGKSKALL